MRTLTPTRLAGAWTRTSPIGAPMGRLHAARRINGALEERALCGFRIPGNQLRQRPFAFFDETDRRACSTCVVEAWDLV